MKKFMLLITILAFMVIAASSCASSNKMHKNGLYGKSNHRYDYSKGMYYCGPKTKVRVK